MSTFQKTIILGRVGMQPDKKTFADGNSIVKFNLATEDKWMDKTGQIQSTTDWHKCQAYGRIGDVVAKYCNKGDTILVEGKLKTREFQSTDNVKRYVTEIHVTSVKLVKTKHNAEETKQEHATAPTTNSYDKMGVTVQEDGFERIDVTDNKEIEPNDLPF